MKLKYLIPIIVVVLIIVNWKAAVFQKDFGTLNKTLEKLPLFQGDLEELEILSRYPAYNAKVNSIILHLDRKRDVAYAVAAIPKFQNTKKIALSINAAIKNRAIADVIDCLVFLPQLEDLKIVGKGKIDLSLYYGNIKKLKRLDIYSSKMRWINIEGLNELVYLNLTDNELEEMPKGLSSLKKLKYLYLNNNNIASIPSYIEPFSELEILDLSNNKINYLPHSFVWNLKKIKKLNLTNNQLVTTKYIFGMDALEELFLAENQLEVLDEDIANLKQLVKLNVRNNKLAKLPDGINQLRQLKYVDLSYNELRNLPNNLEGLDALEDLDLNTNYLAEIPKSIGVLMELESLNLTNNNITELPEELLNLPNLKHFYIGMNRLKVLDKSKFKTAKTITIWK